MFKNCLGTTSTIGMILLGFSGPAWAVETDSVAQRLKEAVAQKSLLLNWSAARQDGDAVILEGVTVGASGTTESLSIGTVTLDDVSDEGGTIRIGHLSIPDQSAKLDELTVEIAGATMTDVQLPPPGAGPTTLPAYSSSALQSLAVRRGDTLLFSLEDADSHISEREDGPMEFDGTVGRFTANLAAVENPDLQRAAAAMGYESIEGSIEMKGSWQLSDGRFTLSRYAIDIEDAGTVDVNLDMTGYTPEVMTGIEELRRKMTSQPADSDNTATGIAMLGLLQQINFHRASIRFEDAALTGKLLDYAASQQGVEAADIVNQAKAILPFMLAQFSPELSRAVNDAVGTFLDDPKSLEIRANPSAPVPVAKIVADAAAAPRELPQTLGVTVIANEPK